MLFKLIEEASINFVFKLLETSKLLLIAILFFTITFLLLFCDVINRISFCELSITKLLLIAPRFREGLIV